MVLAPSKSIAVSAADPRGDPPRKTKGRPRQTLTDHFPTDAIGANPNDGAFVCLTNHDNKRIRHKQKSTPVAGLE